MTSQYASLVTEFSGGILAQDPGGKQIATNTLQQWITGNIVPLLLLVIAIVLLWIGGRGDNAGVARRGISLVIGLIVLGIALSNKAGAIGTFFANLIVG